MLLLNPRLFHKLYLFSNLLIYLRIIIKLIFRIITIQRFKEHRHLNHPNSNPLLELIAIFNFCFNVYRSLYSGSSNIFEQVCEIGNVSKLSLIAFTMVKGGDKSLNPKQLGLVHQANMSKLLFYYQENYRTTLQKSIIV